MWGEERGAINVIQQKYHRYSVVQSCIKHKFIVSSAKTDQIKK